VRGVRVNTRSLSPYIGEGEKGSLPRGRVGSEEKGKRARSNGDHQRQKEVEKDGDIRKGGCFIGGE